MITRLNTYEGVPLGTGNFDGFLSYIRAFLGANFGFSTNVISNNGGYFQDDNFQYEILGNNPNEIRVFTPATKDVGSLFGQQGGEYYRFNVIRQVSPNQPQVNEWQVLATDANVVAGEYAISNSSVNEMPLPYRPMAPYDDGFKEGYYEVRFNGIPQSYTFSYTSGQFKQQTVSLSSLVLGAEYPRPIKDDRYDDTFLSSVTNAQFVSSYDSMVAFPYTNFGIDYGGHIILYRENGSDRRFVYVPQDLSSNAEPAGGTYKVVDFSRGIIKLSITNSQLLQLAWNSLEDPSAVDFTVVSAEQLQESMSGGSRVYSSRYGDVYNGGADLSLLVSYTFDGVEHELREVSQGEMSSDTGSTLLIDSSGKYGDALILAISYPASVNRSELIRVQSNRYEPDTFQLYYSSGISANTVESDIRAIVEHNPTSWYNRDVLGGDYFPVARSTSTWYSFLDATDLLPNPNLFSEVFNPNYAFQISDTLTLKSLGDVPNSFNDGDILIYNSTTTGFDAINFRLSNLRDTQISFPATGHILTYVSTGVTPSWRNFTIPQVLGYTPVSRLGDANISGALKYTTGSQSGWDNNTLVTKLYVDNAVGSGSVDAGMALSAHAALTGIDGVHGATQAVSGDTIARRTAMPTSITTPGEGLLKAGITQWDGYTAPGIASHTDQGFNLLNARWLFNHSDSAFATSNTYVRRDTSGRIIAATPATSENSTQVATTAWARTFSRNRLESMFTGGGSAPFCAGYAILGGYLLMWAPTGTQNYPSNTSGGDVAPNTNIWARYTLTHSSLIGKNPSLHTVFAVATTSTTTPLAVSLNTVAKPEPGNGTPATPAYREVVNNSTGQIRVSASVNIGSLSGVVAVSATVFWLLRLSTVAGEA